MFLTDVVAVAVILVISVILQPLVESNDKPTIVKQQQGQVAKCGSACRVLLIGGRPKLPPQEMEWVVATQPLQN